jgi:hypothetical protein
LGSEKFFTFIAINFVWHANFLFGKNSQDQAKSLNHHYSERERETKRRERSLDRASRPCFKKETLGNKREAPG